MESIHIEIPVSVGDKVYRTTRECTIQSGEVNDIKAVSNFYRVDRNNTDSKTKVVFTVNWGYCNSTEYTVDKLNVDVYLDKKELVKQLVNSL